MRSFHSQEKLAVRDGYYVNGRRFELNLKEQAKARANFLSREFGRVVNVMLASDGVATVTYSAIPSFPPSTMSLA